MWSKINRLQLAARLNLALRYKRGVGLDVSLLLHHRRYAREALELCQESGDFGLSHLASQLEDATAAEDAKAHLAIAATTTRAELAELLPAIARADRPSRGAASAQRRLSATPH